MRVLVGAACVALIAAVGYYFWSDWQASRAASYPNDSAECLDVLARLYLEGAGRPALSSDLRAQLTGSLEKCRSERLIDPAQEQQWIAQNVGAS